MSYTTITAEIAKKCPELSERVGETIETKELAGIQAKYVDAKAITLTPKRGKKAAGKAPVKRVRKSTRKAR